MIEMSGQTWRFPMSATAPVISIDAPPLRPAPAVPGRRGWARIAKLGLGVLLVAMLTTGAPRSFRGHLSAAG